MRAAAFRGVWPILYAFFDERERLDRGVGRMSVMAEGAIASEA